MTKEQLIKGIKSVIGKWGSLTTADMEMSSSPMFNYMSKDHFSTIERFGTDDVEVITYVHEVEVDSNTVSYEDLDYDLLFDIHNELESYDIGMTKTMEKMRDENWN